MLITRGFQYGLPTKGISCHGAETMHASLIGILTFRQWIFFTKPDSIATTISKQSLEPFGMSSRREKWKQSSIAGKNQSMSNPFGPQFLGLTRVTDPLIPLSYAIPRVFQLREEKEKRNSLTASSQAIESRSIV